MLEQSFPARARDLFFRFDFIEHDLRPGPAPGVQLLLSLHANQFGDLVAEFLGLRLNFPARARREPINRFFAIPCGFRPLPDRAQSPG